MPHLIYEKRDGIAILTLNRPEKRNSLSPQMVVELAAAWTDFRDDPDMRVAILTGVGDKAFCAGADLARLIPLMTGTRQPEDEWDEQLLGDPEMLEVALLRRFELYKPIIAAVNGTALAGGTEILQTTDIRVAVPHARFGLSEVQRGLFPAGGSTVRLARQIPYCKAMEIILTGQPMSAEEACRIGLLNELVEPGQLMARAQELAAVIAANGPLSVQACKESVLLTSGVPLDEALKIEAEYARKVFSSEDAIEGPLAFIEGREPVFKGC